MLLVSQSVHRVGGGCPTGWQPGGQQDNHKEEERYDTQHRGIVPIGSIKAGKQKTRRESRKNTSAQATSKGDFGAARKHQIGDLGTGSPQSHPNSKFGDALTNEIRDYSKDSN